MAETTAKNKKKVAASNGNAKQSSRVGVLKTYKLYIGGAFPRTESGRYTKLTNAKGEVLANVCRASRKDFRNAVQTAGKALPGWSGKSAYNRSQILYRIAEMMEQRAPLLVSEMVQMGYTEARAKAEVELCIDRSVHYAGWCDKYQQIFSAVNPVASSHFNFSLPEPTGVVSIVAGNDTALLSLMSNLLPAIAGGNTAVVLASETYPLSAITLAEVINDSDVPGGVVNLLTGLRSELLKHMAGHMGVHALIADGIPHDTAAQLQEQCTDNLKRYYRRSHNWQNPDSQNPYLILDTQEIKTTWHPVEVIDGKGGGY